VGARLELVQMEGNARIFDEMKELLVRQKQAGELEKEELRGWIIREDARFREGMETRQAALTKQLVEVGSLREGLLDEVRTAARKDLEIKLGDARAAAAI